jgi:hypothetical protein
MYDERRAHTRFPLDCEIVIRYGGKFIFSNISDISCGGVCINTDHPSVKKPGPVEVMMDLDDSHKDIAIMGNIIRIGKENSQKIGIEFNMSSMEGIRQVGHYLLTADR